MGGNVIIGPDRNVFLGIGNVGGRRTQSENVYDGLAPIGTGGILKITQEGQVAPHPPLGTKHLLSIYYAYGIAKDGLARNVTDPPADLVDFDGTGIYSDPEFVWNMPIAPTAIKFLSSDKLGKQY